MVLLSHTLPGGHGIAAETQQLQRVGPSPACRRPAPRAAVRARCSAVADAEAPAAALAEKAEAVAAEALLGAEGPAASTSSTTSTTSSSSSTSASAAAPPPAITLTPKALKQLRRLREDNGDEALVLRMGVKSGGCSGMSYVLDFEAPDNVKADDSVMEYEGGFRLVCDAKSLLYLFGMELDYSSALIDGGFKFNNPLATKTCGCGKSFGT